jgi:rod shape-determining protein MreB
VGHLAKQMQGRTPDSVRVVRPLRHGVIADFELCEAMLGYLFRKAQGSAWRIKPRVLVSVPGCITSVEKRAVYNSVQRAGAGRVWLLPKAMAAAVGVGLPIAEPLASMVCDVGGGTTEIAVISLAETVASQSIRVGGDAMDAAIIDDLRRRYSLRIGPPVAEQLRIDLGSAYPLEQEQVRQVSGIDTIGGLPRQATVTSEEVREALRGPLEAIVEGVKATLDGCTPELAADLLDHGLVLCGGGAKLRRLDRFLQEQTGLPTRIADDPQAAVARGMLICLEHLDQWRPTLLASHDDL